ncbi:agmatine deiminase [Frondihabitans sp. PAMC 28766]|uniref:agmatine deiminase family protein n=1 Tax=Frondihabitans sp. PAMC 28766 TaxID=1795630 RepID=UPI00078B6B6D|nr:agmatine deiminase family protein [Frondihabitans sp. PAMC 28766]AMM22100.1 agmatine deiminase [Frondihabitans sp. PAMC 28766]
MSPLVPGPWRMPAETEPHARSWMAFPTGGYTLGDDAASAEEARAAWASVAHAVAEFEPVTMVVDPSAREDARRHLSETIEVVEAPLDDSWIRDSGPSFVVPAAGSSAAGPGAADSAVGGSDAAGLGAVDWIFNGWGAQAWASWQHDREVGRFVADQAGARILPSLLVNEGGAIHVDGRGTVLVTETVQLDQGRNPYADKARVEAELARTIGATHVVWLPRGLTRDYEEFGTRGHVDMVAAMPSPGVVLLHSQNDPAHPDHLVSSALRSLLKESQDATGRPFEVVDLPAPTELRDETGWVDHSYVNHFVVNGGVIACGFGDPAADSRAASILASVYPGRRVVTVDARPIFARGGGIHCITQQEPALSL